MYDVIVVGARCAGSPLAMLLARRGHRVLLCDKAHFPSDTISTHLIWQAALARVQRWGILDRILSLGAPRIRRATFDLGEFKLTGYPPPLDGIDYAVAPRRTLLDKTLVDAAVEAGAELREGFQVAGIVWEKERVVGIRAQSHGGSETAERCRIVVGADGTHSLIARSVDAAKYNTRPSTACAYYTYWQGGPRIEEFRTFFRKGFGGGAVPTNDDLTCVVAGWTDSFLAPNTRPEDGYRTILEHVPYMAEFPRTARQAERLAGFRQMPGYFRNCWGEGWALAGDAGYHKHPLSAQGISDAFRDADLLSDAIDRGLSDPKIMNHALAAYQAQRDRAVMPMYESTCARAELTVPPPQLQALFRALSGNQHEADRFFGTDAGTVPMETFFATENIQRIIGTAP